MEDPNMLMRDPNDVSYHVCKITIEQEMIGVFTQCMIGRMVKAIILSRFHIRYVL